MAFYFKQINVDASCESPNLMTHHPTFIKQTVLFKKSYNTAFKRYRKRIDSKCKWKRSQETGTHTVARQSRDKWSRARPGNNFKRRAAYQQYDFMSRQYRVASYPVPGGNAWDYVEVRHRDGVGNGIVSDNSHSPRTERLPFWGPVRHNCHRHGLHKNT